MPAPAHAPRRPPGTRRPPRRLRGRRVRHAGRGDRGRSAGGEGYAFSLWSDSLLLNCDNCFSCTEGVSLPDAKVLARFGRISLWLYGLREAWKPE